MKILVVCQYYYPEPFRITDICEEWVRRGHEVQVITGLPNYPLGEIYDGYKSGKNREENINGVKIHRCFEIPRKKGVFYRFLNYYSYAISAKRYLKKCKEEFDVVFINQLSPIMMANPALEYKRKHGTKTVLYCLDLWPESLVAGGIKRNSFLYKYYHNVSKKIYKSVDRIAVTSRLFKNYFIEQFAIDEDKISYLPQYAEDIFENIDCKKDEQEQINLLFAGNIGQAQSVETIVRAAAETMDIVNLRWHIVGDGSALEACKKLALELKVNNIIFYGRKSLDEMPQFYKEADALLVTLMNDDILSLTLPGKVQTYMAAEKPIMAAANGEIAFVLDKANCGFCVPAEDYHGLACRAREFCVLDVGEREKYSQNARQFYKDNFSKAIFFEKVDELIR